MSNLTTTKQAGTIRVWLQSDDVTRGISDALSSYMKPDVFKSQMLISLSNPDCAKCTPKSQFEVVHQCAQWALLPSLDQVALIPRRNRNTGNYDLTAMVQWQGYQAMMFRVPGVRDIRARLVHTSDTYEFDPLTERLTHRYDPFDAEREFRTMKDLRGGYLVITFDDGRPEKWHYVSKQVFEKARKSAQTTDIWDAWFYEQCLKTVYRNAFARRVINYDPFVAQQVTAAIEQEDVVMGNDPSRVIETTATPVETAAPVSRSQQLAQQMNRDIDEMLTTPEPTVPPEPEPAPEPPKKTARKKKPPKAKTLIPDDADDAEPEVEVDPDKPATYEDCIRAIESMTVADGTRVQEMCRKAAKNPQQYQDLITHLADKERELMAGSDIE
jgi:recombinational DNA repair protein RecT